MASRPFAPHNVPAGKLFPAIWLFTGKNLSNSVSDFVCINFKCLTNPVERRTLSNEKESGLISIFGVSEIIKGLSDNVKP
jgi:hypothetical protein